MKKCSKCDRVKEPSRFYKNKARHDDLSTYCIDCTRTDDTRDYKRRYRLAKRTVIQKIKDIPCIDCGVKYEPEKMQFDHTEDNKEFNISHAVGEDIPLSKILKEIEKCEIVCFWCHVERTKNRRIENG